MELKLKENIKTDEDIKKIYTYTENLNKDYIISILKKIEEDYGIINKIVLYNKEENHLVSTRYKSIEEVENSDINLNNLNIVDFSCRGKYINFKLDLQKKEFRIWDSTNSMNQMLNEEKDPVYYQSEFGDIIRHVPGTTDYYQLENDKWVLENKYISQFRDVGYSFEKIDYIEETLKK